MSTELQYPKGLEGVIAAQSRICKIDGEQGKLYYLGYPIDQLVESADFEEVTYLLLNGELPNAAERDDFSRRMREGRHLREPILDMIRNFPAESHPMELLQSVVSYLSGYVQHKIHHGPHCNCRDTLHQVAQLTSVIAALHRFRNGLEYVPPRDDLSEPAADDGEIMDKCLVLHAEHSFNASTFTARVVASTQSTCYSSISAAIGALYGSLHGGANERVMAMVERIGSPERAEQFVKDLLERKEKVMGMGHRVYRAKDPRSILMEQYLEELLKTVENTFREIMEEKGKPIYPNVDFFSGAVYSLLGIPAVLFTPLFAAARVSGWLAHILEQRELEQRLFRPKALYVGDMDKEIIPLNLRK